MAKKSHTHKFIKISLGYAPIWKCAAPDCSFFVHMAQEYIIIGRYSFCWECGEKFIIDEESVKNDMPKCHDCIHGIKSEESEELIEMIMNIKIVLAKRGLTSLKELDPSTITSMQTIGTLPKDLSVLPAELLVGKSEK